MPPTSIAVRSRLRAGFSYFVTENLNFDSLSLCSNEFGQGQFSKLEVLEKFKFKNLFR